MRYEETNESWFRRLNRNGDGRITQRRPRGHLFSEMNFERLDAAAGYCGPLDPGCPTHYPRRSGLAQECFQKADRTERAN